jgi:hypothetical protein
MATTKGKRFRRLKRALAVLAALVILAFVGLELFARFYLGLGTPVLYIADAEMEYRLKPSQDVHRIGNHIVVNPWSQRCGPVEKTKSDPRELRVLLIGDSIVFCGTQIDQPDTIGSVLERLLNDELDRPVRVLTIATGSWGPANETAYLKKFGTFDADAAVWIFSANDWFDEPNFVPTVGIHPQYPDHNPILAAWEGWDRYARIPVMARIHATLAAVGLGSEEAAPAVQEEPTRPLQVDALRQGLDLLERDGPIPVHLYHWPSRIEIEQGYNESDWRRFTEPAYQRRLPVTDWTTVLRDRPDHGRSLFLSDNLFHVSKQGAEWIAQSLLPDVLAMLAATPTTDHATNPAPQNGPRQDAPAIR